MKALQAARQQLNKWKEFEPVPNTLKFADKSYNDIEKIQAGESYSDLVKRKIKHYENQIVILSQKLGLTHNSNI